MLLCNCFNFKPAITYNSLAFPFTTSLITKVPNNQIISVPCYRNLQKKPNTPKIIQIQCYCATVSILSSLLLTIAWLSTTSLIYNVPNNQIISVPCYRNMLKKQNTPKV